MKKQLPFNFLVDKENKKIKVERAFDAPLPLTWSAWTRAEILDQWWAPEPWRAETKSMDFSEGGRWLYCMIGPEGEKAWSVFDYETIHWEKDFSGRDAFSNEEGVIDESMPRMQWKNSFSAGPGETTRVDVELSFDKLSDLEATIRMGFKEGFTKGLENLDAWLLEQKK